MLQNPYIAHHGAFECMTSCFLVIVRPSPRVGGEMRTNTEKIVVHKSKFYVTNGIQHA